MRAIYDRNTLLRLRDVIGMQFTASTHKLEFRQINLTLLRCKNGADRTATIAAVDTFASGVTRYLEWLIGISLHFQLREMLQGRAVGRFVELGNPAEHFAATGIHHCPLHIHTPVWVRRSPDCKFHRDDIARRFHDHLGVLRIDDNLFLLELDTVAKQVRRRVPDVGFAAG
ncbi:hypothetical protein D3C76_1101620 [compost metagenome]